MGKYLSVFWSLIIRRLSLCLKLDAHFPKPLAIPIPHHISNYHIMTLISRGSTRLVAEGAPTETKCPRGAGHQHHTPHRSRGQQSLQHIHTGLPGNCAAVCPQASPAPRPFPIFELQPSSRCWAAFKSLFSLNHPRFTSVPVTKNAAAGSNWAHHESTDW